jgi:hypothetical protein
MFSPSNNCRSAARSSIVPPSSGAYLGFRIVVPTDGKAPIAAVSAGADPIVGKWMDQDKKFVHIVKANGELDVPTAKDKGTWKSVKEGEYSFHTDRGYTWTAVLDPGGKSAKTYVANSTRAGVWTRVE